MSLATLEAPLGRYRILEWLGSGGMGAVYRALDTELGDEIALKMLRPGLSAHATERFRQEVRLARRVVHPNVARMFDIGEHDGRKFLTMELIHGVSLAQRARSGPLAWEELLAVADDICAGLSAAHAAGVIHRDLKPDNILLDAGGRAVITDFGIARAMDELGTTQTGALVGTPAYMAPEQLDGFAVVDERADVFSLGVLLFELATGERPWDGSSAVAVAVAIATRPAREVGIVRPDAPASFAATVARCLARDPADRFDSAAAVAAALRDERREPVGVPAPRAAGPTVAILAIECPDDDADLADGLAEAFAEALGRAGDVRVRLATTWVGLNTDPRDTGGRLGVDHVLTGSVRRTERGLRIALRVARTADGFLVWSEHADCEPEEILTAAEWLAASATEALARGGVRASRGTDPRAADLYLKGRAELRRYWGEHLVNAVALLDEAARLAPDSVPIHAALAEASMQAWTMTEQPEMRALAAAAVERALEADPRMRTARLASAAYRLGTGDMERGAYDVGVALAGSPTSAEAHTAAARLLAELGEPDEARERYSTALGLETGQRATLSAELAWLDGFDGEEASAEARLCAIAGEVDPALRAMADVYQFRVAMWFARKERLPALHARLDAQPGAVARAFSAGFGPAIKTGAIDLPAWAGLHAWAVDPQRPWRIALSSLEWIAEMAMVFDRPDLALDAAEQLVAHGSAGALWFDRCPSLRRLANDAALGRARATVHNRARAALLAYRAGLRA